MIVCPVQLDTQSYWLSHFFEGFKHCIPTFAMFNGPWWVQVADVLRLFVFVLGILTAVELVQRAREWRLDSSEFHYRLLVVAMVVLFMVSVTYTEWLVRGTPPTIRIAVNFIAMLLANRTATRMHPRTEVV